MHKPTHTWTQQIQISSRYTPKTLNPPENSETLGNLSNILLRVYIPTNIKAQLFRKSLQKIPTHPHKPTKIGNHENTPLRTPANTSSVLFPRTWKPQNPESPNNSNHFLNCPNLKIVKPPKTLPNTYPTLRLYTLPRSNPENPEIFTQINLNPP